MFWQFTCAYAHAAPKDALHRLVVASSLLALATLQHTVNAFLKLIFDKHPLVVVLQSILVFASALITILRIGNNDLMHCEKYFRMIRVKEQLQKKRDSNKELTLV